MEPCAPCSRFIPTFQYSNIPFAMLHPLLYELNTRCWLSELSERARRRVTLANVPDSEFQRWQQLGFTHVWLMGVWTTGPRSRAVARAATGDWQERGESPRHFRAVDIAGSPYAISEYRVARELGGEAGLQRFRRKLHGHGMRLLLDFVPNHVGLDHPWLKERPDLFVQSPAEIPGAFSQETSAGTRWIAHGRDPNFEPWTDTAQLDYRQPATRTAMKDVLLSVAERCDGVRCDMAMLELNGVFAKTWSAFPPFGVPPSSSPGSEPAEGGSSNHAAEFWPDAIRATRRARADFLFLAEAYWSLEEQLLSQGFDYAYDKTLYDELIRRDSVGAQRHLLGATARFLAGGAHFLENHDEARIASKLPFAEHRAAALLVLTLPGMCLLHDGQLDGARIRTPVQLSCRPPEPPQRNIVEMYERLLQALKQSAVGRGRYRLLAPRVAWPGNPTAQDIVLIQWQAATPDFDLVAINLASHRSQCYAPLEIENLGRSDWLLTDLVGDEKHRRSGVELAAQGLYLDLVENGAQLLHFSPGGVQLAGVLPE